jgi:tRNA (guanine-N7-)-methyltransferase
MKRHPYAEAAPRLPEGATIDPRTLVASGGRPVELEVGPGRGGFVFERLAVSEQIFMIGLEIRLKWATIVDKRLHEQGLATRARVFAEDARSAIQKFPDACLDTVFVHFPDPWWKKRHHKRLVVGQSLLGPLSRTVRAGGQVFVQTDVEERALAYEAEFEKHPEFEAVAATARIQENPFQARSPREHRALADGLPIFRLLYRRR